MDLSLKKVPPGPEDLGHKSLHVRLRCSLDRSLVVKKE